jgi:heme-degrading monooxygenase HmoA
MPYAITNKYPGGTKEQYEAVLAEVHPPDGLPDGQTHHYAGPTEDGGWLVVAIWDSKSSFESFRDGTLLPALQSVGDSGFPSPPEMDAFEVANEMTA